MAPQNYFSHASAAARYAQFRPYFHPEVMKRLVAFTWCARFGRALDVACGTGQSTRALTAIAGQVDAVDKSASMLAQAPALPNVTYQEGTAEALPFAEGTFDLVTVGLAFHWFEQGKFLDEANRVLKPSGWLVFYNHIFSKEMKENPEFSEWVGTVYLGRYMTPPRSRRKISEQFAQEHGFELVQHEEFDSEVPMTWEQLVGYFMTQSNVIASVEQGTEKIEDVAKWLEDGVRPFFKQPTGTMRFRGDVWYLRKQN